MLPNTIYVCDTHGYLAAASECHIPGCRAKVEAFHRSRCTCPKGFGQVVSQDCPTHGVRRPEHVITGAMC